MGHRTTFQGVKKQIRSWRSGYKEWTGNWSFNLDSNVDINR